MVKDAGIQDQAQYNVVARNAKEAMNKAVRTAQRDMGYKSGYTCVFLERSDTRIIAG